MGNCLEPSESEVQKAKRAKLMKMAARDASFAAVNAPPPQMMYPYPFDPYNDPRLTGVYIPSQTPPQPTAYAVVDPRTGQTFIVHDPGPMHTSAMPVHVPFVDERMLYHSRRYRADNSNANSFKKSDRRSSKKNDGVDGDVTDGKTEKSRGHSKQSSVVKGAEEHRKSSTREFVADGLQRNSTAEMVATIDVHANENQKTQQNGDVKLYTKSGVMDLEAEPEPIIIDFLDPILPTAKITPDVSNVEYETSNGFLNAQGQSSRSYGIEAVLGPESRVHADHPLPGNTYAVPSAIQETSAVHFHGNQTEQHDMNRHSTPTPTNVDVDIFPPKIFDAEKTSPMPDILRKTLSPTAVSNHLPSDLVDVVITYSVLGEYELGIVRRLTRQLELVGLSVWAERLGDSSKARKSDKTAQAIIGAKVMIVMLSEGSSAQRFIRDHVAIATMTNISIFPVVSESSIEVKNALPRELKVLLAPYAWTELVGENEDSFLFQLRSLARSVQDEVEERSSSTFKEEATRGNIFQRQKSLTNQALTANASSFWDIHFGHRDSIKCERLEHALKDAFKMTINDTVPEDLQAILFTAVKNRTAGSRSDVRKSDFVEACKSSNNKEMDVWEAIVQIAGMIQAVRDVFDVESTVRHLAVEYNEYFSNPSAMRALRDLLSDPDPNFRSVAVVSLARCMAFLSNFQFLDCVEATLEDGDRLVREAGCLALGHLKAESAVQKLIHVWRNDVISQVREAAKMSLDQIGGQEVIDAMRVAGVLATEIRELTDGTQDD